MIAFLLPLVLLIGAPEDTVSAPEKESVQVALPGFHAGAEPITPGADWMGVFRDGEGFAMRPVVVSAKAVRNAMSDGPSEKTAVEIGLSGAGRPVFLVRGVPGARAGTLLSCRFEPTVSMLYPGQCLEIELGNKHPRPRWRLAVTGHAEMQSTKGAYTKISDYALHLGQGYGPTYVRQELARLPEAPSDSGPGLVWAGDLDQDGKLDLLLDLRVHELSTHLALFLSSAAEEGALVGLAAVWHAYSNC